MGAAVDLTVRRRGKQEVCQTNSNIVSSLVGLAHLLPPACASDRASRQDCRSVSAAYRGARKILEIFWIFRILGVDKGQNFGKIIALVSDSCEALY